MATKNDGPIFSSRVQDPPEPLTKRHAYVQLHPWKGNTIVLPHDPPDPSGSKWFPTVNDPTSQPPRPVRANNDIEYLIGGEETFRAIADAMSAANKAGDFVYIIGWWVDLDLTLSTDPDGAFVGKSLREIMLSLSRTGVEIRALMPRNTPGLLANAKTRDFLNSPLMPTGSALIDEKTADLVGTHHQKIIVIKANSRLVAFCGGVDLNKDRIKVVDKGRGQPLHDVHCKIQGPAAYDILAIFCERWNDLCEWLDGDGGRSHGAMDNVQELVLPIGVPPISRRILREKGVIQDPLPYEKRKLSGLSDLNDVNYYEAPGDDRKKERTNFAVNKTLMSAKRLAAGTLTVQVARTSGNAKSGPLFDARLQGPFLTPYGFAPEGERSIRAMVMNAIENSERFIYLEDQYMVSGEIAELLAARLLRKRPNLEHVTILTSHPELCDMPDGAQFRRQFVRRLKQFGSRVRIFCLCNPGRRLPDGRPCKRRDDEDITMYYYNSYVHAKVWIFDDEFAIIGSANCNNRGMSHDSEVAVGIFDPSQEARATLRFAHRLRIRLWARHLGMDTAEGHAELSNGVASAAHWMDPPPSARIVPFSDDAARPRTREDMIFSPFSDPSSP